MNSSRDRIEVVDVDRRRHAREAAAPGSAEEARDRVSETAGQAERLALEPEDVHPIDRGRIEDEPDEPLSHRLGTEHRLQDDRTAHRPAHQHRAPGTVRFRVVQGRDHVGPLGATQSVSAVIALGSFAVVAIRDEERVPPSVPGGDRRAQPLMPLRAAAVHLHDPTRRGLRRGHEPRGRRAQGRLDDDVFVGVPELPRAEVVPAVHTAALRALEAAEVDRVDAPAYEVVVLAHDIAEARVA